jgi:hypothetical protein
MAKGLTAPRAAGWVLASAIFLLPRSAPALDPPHDASNDITCADCHAAHGFGLVPRGAEQEARCKSCHNPTGKAPTMTDVANHVVHGLAVDCGSCHDPHVRHMTTDPHVGGQTAPNLKLIRSDTGKYSTRRARHGTASARAATPRRLIIPTTARSTTITRWGSRARRATRTMGASLPRGAVQTAMTSRRAAAGRSWMPGEILTGHRITCRDQSRTVVAPSATTWATTSRARSS